ncbi:MULTISPECIES: mannose-1-phosphate guanylyltransferase/mannose-6-phosphate isomerase [unclassified Arsukibacterium]|uniref:mannose-1-phosphate guanylyltransferase/mannose-6-phosphate isomerase n=1 Tax=unclassified Arsukibacterium TaxID=2635278 RepID=UPI000C90DA27|nr:MULTISPECIES: mannose-1-phosphate guanylyltransferase/mannose-6-phosphate isomerase [unclassified Arsukibacterium]MAA94076.1 mannose-1-phosphate guanylyltransferase/mannose-6-phosphate isomerase [Rheinheimera sp.]HAW93882.1 mannose-1-phosphate guanylyltransferase/mannose-6-phosphate isomerase [Candidatus Azambacteria bacterium]|tara:strand:- start:70412 stop:71836 length:1425 start_codon:yes stop_codon:yes gene_type:complete
MIPVILSGGSGTRLWPLSRAKKPKQFLSLVNEKSMLQNTLLRLKGLDELSPPLVVCNEDHRFMVAEQLRELNISDACIMLEPVGRNTAPAIAIAAIQAMQLQDNKQDPVLLVLAADHVIQDIPAFQQAVVEAKLAAEAGKLVTFGIVPVSAHTGYGYIRRSQQNIDQIPNTYQVTEFKEKPDKKTAEHYLASGEYCWNSGMFMFKASSLLAELEKFAPEIVKACRLAVTSASEDLDFVRVDNKAFSASPADSLDYAVLEKSDNTVMVPLNAGWSDVGSYDALWDVMAKDAQGNACRGDVMLEATRNSYINAEEKLVAVIGLDNVIVVETKDAVLVADKNNIQQVKSIVQRLQSYGRSEVDLHREVFRPWGKYDSVDQGKRYQVKHITVKPGAKLSVQKHHHRAEHWVVVSGTALVRNGDEEFMVTENESTFIPIGVVHSLENPGKIPLELIEVQSGSYLGEDDIVRFADKYGRE